jgi:hypothetical protein
MDRQKAALVTRGIEQRQLLMAVHHVEHMRRSQALRALRKDEVCRRLMVTDGFFRSSR